VTNHPRKAADYFRVLFDLRGIILAVSLLQLIVISLGVSRWYEELGRRPSDFYPNAELNIPIVLVLASVMLLISRWWSHLIAFVVSGWVIYFLGYVALRAASKARDVPLLSSEAVRVWFAAKSNWQIQEFLQLALALIILCYVVVALLRQWRGPAASITAHT
jgi:hypothetical protein